jgi:hypothetical protein
MPENQDFYLIVGVLKPEGARRRQWAAPWSRRISPNDVYIPIRNAAAAYRQHDHDDAVRISRRRDH